MVNPIKKGKSGEVEFCKWLQDNLSIMIDRNYNQAAGGADIITNNFCFEIKRREVLDLDGWWLQVVNAVKLYNGNSINSELRVMDKKGRIPIVAFRQNRKKWEFLVPAILLGCSKGYARLNERTFIEFASKCNE